MSMGLWAMGMTISGTSVLGAETLPHQHHHDATNPMTSSYRTKDGRFVALAFLQSDRYWPEFCRVVDRLDWLADERFADAAGRAAHRGALITLLDDLFSQRTSDEWRDVLAQQEGQWDVLLPAGSVRHDEQAIANGYVQRVRHAGTGKIDLVPAPAQFDGVAPALGKAPGIGADTDDVLGCLGRDADALAVLRTRGVVR